MSYFADMCFSVYNLMTIELEICKFWSKFNFFSKML